MCSQPGRWMIVAIQVIISSQVLAQLHFLAVRYCLTPTSPMLPLPQAQSVDLKLLVQVPFPSTGRTKGDRFCRSGLGSLLTNRR